MMRTARRWLILAVVAAAAALAPVAPARAQIVVGVHRDNRPWEFRDRSGTYVGFDIDLAKSLGKEMGVAVEIRPMGFADLFESLAEDRVDAVASSITITPEREARFAFTQPYYMTSQAVVTLKTSGIKDLSGLSGRIVATTPNSSNAGWLEQNGARYAIRSVQAVDGMETALMMLRSGEISAYFGDEPALLYALLGSRDLAVIARMPTHDRYGVMTKKGSSWSVPLEDALAALKANGELVAIHRKWFGTRPTPDSPIYRILPRR